MTYCYVNLLSDSDIKDRIKYHKKHKVLDSKFVLFATIAPTNRSSFDEVLNFFYKQGDDKIYFFKIPEKHGSGYTQGFVWKPKELKSITKSNFKMFTDKLCKQGQKQKMLETVNKYLKMLHENFNASIALEDISGDFKDEWTDCYEVRCHKRYENKYEKNVCKADCQIRACAKSISRINSAKSHCAGAVNPNRCKQSMENGILYYQNKITQAKESQIKSQQRLKKFRG